MATLYFSSAALRHNYRLLRKRAGVPLIPVLKADAYGHGAADALLTLREEGARLLALANERELFLLLNHKKVKSSLQKDGISFLLLGTCEMGAVEELSHLSVILSVHSLSYALMLEERLSAIAAPPFPVHLKLETGMNRLGLTETEAKAVCALPHLRVEGVYSHFGEAATDAARTLAQTAAFAALCARLPLSGAVRHLSAGAAILRYGALGFDAARVGLPLYGVCPTGTEGEGLLPVMRLAARVMAVKEIGAGEGMGYGSFRAPHPMRVAVIDLGYADGLPPSASLRGARVWVKERLCPLVGEICMDRAFVEVGDLPLAEGEEVTVFGHGAGDAERFAREAAISPYVLLSLRSARTLRRLS